MRVLARSLSLSHTHRTPPGRGLCPQLPGLPSAAVLKPHATAECQVHEDQYFGFLALSPAASTSLSSQQAPSSEVREEGRETRV